MILTGQEILRRFTKDIKIYPLDPKKLNPNLYNLTLFNSKFQNQKTIQESKYFE